MKSQFQLLYMYLLIDNVFVTRYLANLMCFKRSSKVTGLVTAAMDNRPRQPSRSSLNKNNYVAKHKTEKNNKVIIDISKMYYLSLLPHSIAFAITSGGCIH